MLFVECGTATNLSVKTEITGQRKFPVTRNIKKSSTITVHTRASAGIQSVYNMRRPRSMIIKSILRTLSMLEISAKSFTSHEHSYVRDHRPRMTGYTIFLGLLFFFSFLFQSRSSSLVHVLAGGWTWQAKRKVKWKKFKSRCCTKEVPR